MSISSLTLSHLGPTSPSSSPAPTSLHYTTTSPKGVASAEGGTGGYGDGVKGVAGEVKGVVEAIRMTSNVMCLGELTKIVSNTGRTSPRLLLLFPTLLRLEFVSIRNTAVSESISLDILTALRPKGANGFVLETSQAQLLHYAAPSKAHRDQILKILADIHSRSRRGKSALPPSSPYAVFKEGKAFAMDVSGGPGSWRKGMRRPVHVTISSLSLTLSPLQPLLLSLSPSLSPSPSISLLPHTWCTISVLHTDLVRVVSTSGLRVTSDPDLDATGAADEKRGVGERGDVWLWPLVLVFRPGAKDPEATSTPPRVLCIGLRSESERQVWTTFLQDRVARARARASGPPTTPSTPGRSHHPFSASPLVARGALPSDMDPSSSLHPSAVFDASTTDDVIVLDDVLRRPMGRNRMTSSPSIAESSVASIAGLGGAMGVDRAPVSQPQQQLSPPASTVSKSPSLPPTTIGAVEYGSFASTAAADQPPQNAPADRPAPSETAKSVADGPTDPTVASAPEEKGSSRPASSAASDAHATAAPAPESRSFIGKIPPRPAHDPPVPPHTESSGTETQTGGQDQKGGATATATGESGWAVPRTVKDYVRCRDAEGVLKSVMDSVRVIMRVSESTASAPSDPKSPTSGTAPAAATMTSPISRFLYGTEMQARWDPQGWAEGTSTTPSGSGLSSPSIVRSGMERRGGRGGEEVVCEVENAVADYVEQAMWPAGESGVGNNTGMGGTSTWVRPDTGESTSKPLSAWLTDLLPAGDRPVTQYTLNTLPDTLPTGTATSSAEGSFVGSPSGSPGGSGTAWSAHYIRKLARPMYCDAVKERGWQQRLDQPPPEPSEADEEEVDEDDDGHEDEAGSADAKPGANSVKDAAASLTPPASRSRSGSTASTGAPAAPAPGGKGSRRPSASKINTPSKTPSATASSPATAAKGSKDPSTSSKGSKASLGDELRARLQRQLAGRGGGGTGGARKKKEGWVPRHSQPVTIKPRKKTGAGDDSSSTTTSIPSTTASADGDGTSQRAKMLAKLEAQFGVRNPSPAKPVPRKWNSMPSNQRSDPSPSTQRAMAERAKQQKEDELRAALMRRRRPADSESDDSSDEDRESANSRRQRADQRDRKELLDQFDRQSAADAEHSEQLKATANSLKNLRMQQLEKRTEDAQMQARRDKLNRLFAPPPPKPTAEPPAPPSAAAPAGGDNGGEKGAGTAASRTKSQVVRDDLGRVLAERGRSATTEMGVGSGSEHSSANASGQSSPTRQRRHAGAITTHSPPLSPQQAPSTNKQLPSSSTPVESSSLPNPAVHRRSIISATAPPLALSSAEEKSSKPTVEKTGGRSRAETEAEVEAAANFEHEEYERKIRQVLADGIPLQYLRSSALPIHIVLHTHPPQASMSVPFSSMEIHLTEVTKKGKKTKPRKRLTVESVQYIGRGYSGRKEEGTEGDMCSGSSDTGTISTMTQTTGPSGSKRRSWRSAFSLRKSAGGKRDKKLAARMADIGYDDARILVVQTRKKMLMVLCADEQQREKLFEYLSYWRNC